MKREFYQQKTPIVAQQLLGKILLVRYKGYTLSGIISETEAYSQDEPACHAYQGHRTPRNRAMFLNGGHIYIYFIYGMYYCLNIVTEEEGRGCAVLMRSIIPLKGIATMKKNRGKSITDENLSNGPGKLVIALGIQKEWNLDDVLSPSCPLKITNNPLPVSKKIIKNTRIGITRGKDLFWRFSLG